MKDYLHLTIEDLHLAYVHKEITPLELVKLCLKACKEDTNNCFEYLCEKEAIEAAEKLTEPEEDNLLWGIPYCLKDNFSTKGIPTTGSSNILTGYVPVFDAEVYRRLNEKHAILIGKTTLDELAMGGTGTSGHLGKTYNPYDPTHTHMIGGSSCGSCAAVAAGLVPFALGSDTGDSVRKPASFGGLIGFKPTWGRISRYGLFPFAPSLDHVAYFTRSVKDCALLTTVLSGRDEKDATSSDKEVKKYASLLSGDIHGLKIAVIDEAIKTIVDPVVLSTFNDTIEILKSRGAIVEKIHMDTDLLKAIYPTYIIISCAEATSNNANLDGLKFGLREKGDSYDEIVTKTRTEGFSTLIKRRFVIGGYSLLKENQQELFVRAQKCRHLIVDTFNKIFEDYDLIYLPASPSSAPRFDEKNDNLSDLYLISDNYLAFANFGGYPSLTVPIGFKDGLPFGGNFTGRIFNEETVLNVGYSLLRGTPSLYNLYYKKEIK